MGMRVEPAKSPYWRESEIKRVLCAVDPAHSAKDEEVKIQELGNRVLERHQAVVPKVSRSRSRILNAGRACRNTGSVSARSRVWAAPTRSMSDGLSGRDWPSALSSSAAGSPSRAKSRRNCARTSPTTRTKRTYTLGPIRRFRLVSTPGERTVGVISS